MHSLEHARAGPKHALSPTLVPRAARRIGPAWCRGFLRHAGAALRAGSGCNELADELRYHLRIGGKRVLSGAIRLRHHRGGPVGGLRRRIGQRQRAHRLATSVDLVHGPHQHHREPHQNVCQRPDIGSLRLDRSHRQVILVDHQFVPRVHGPGKACATRVIVYGDDEAVDDPMPEGHLRVEGVADIDELGFKRVPGEEPPRRWRRVRP